MINNEQTIEIIYNENLREAITKLSSLNVAENREPKISGLNGWVYEQTIRYCLEKEFRALGLTPVIEEQVPLQGKAKVDLCIGKVAIEIKARGIFGVPDVNRYHRYKAITKEKEWIYLYLTGGESVKSYRSGMKSVFGEAHAFFLDTKQDWKRFVNEVFRNID